MLVNSEKAEVDKELDELRQKFRDLKQKNEKLVLDSEGHVTQEDHINKMADLKRFVTFIMHSTKTLKAPKAGTKFTSAEFQKMFCPRFIILRSQG